MEILLGILLINCLITNIFLFYHVYNQKNVDRDAAEALKNIIVYLKNEFDANLKTHETMQNWNENNLQLIYEKCEILSQNDKILQDLVLKMAQAMGLQRSNLEDL